MRIIASGLMARGQADTARGALTFPAFVALRDGTLLAACHAGSKKDADDETI